MSSSHIAVDDPGVAFAQRGVAEIPEFLDANEFDRLSRHVDAKVRFGLFHSMQGDIQVDGAPCEYGDPLGEELLSAKTPYLSRVLRLDLVPTYSYMRLYRPGDRLDAHRDRPACEITVSASLSVDSRWPLSILVDGRVCDYCPPPRAAVVFKGHELLHWREPLCGGAPVMQVFFHYVQRQGAFGSWVHDRRASGTEAADRAQTGSGTDTPCS